MTYVITYPCLNHLGQHDSQRLNRFELTDTHPVGTPADLNDSLEADDDVSQPADQKLYQRMIGSLQYAAGGTCPDIAYIVSVLLRFCGKPNNKHLNAAKRVFQYLKGTQDLALTYAKTGNEDLIGFSDSDYAGD